MINVRKSTLKNQIFNTTRHGKMKASRLIKHISPINMGDTAHIINVNSGNTVRCRRLRPNLLWQLLRNNIA